MRRELLTPAQRQHLLALPSSARHIAECYTFSAADLELVSIRRGEQNRLGFALQLCFLRHPGRAWTPEEQASSPMVRFIAHQIDAEPEHLTDYARRDETRREHLSELLGALGLGTFGLAEYRALSGWLLGLARTTDHGLVLVQALISELRKRRVVVPVLTVLERLATAVRSGLVAKPTGRLPLISAPSSASFWTLCWSNVPIRRRPILAGCASPRECPAPGTSSSASSG